MQPEVYAVSVVAAEAQRAQEQVDEHEFLRVCPRPKRSAAHNCARASVLVFNRSRWSVETIDIESGLEDMHQDLVQLTLLEAAHLRLALAFAQMLGVTGATCPAAQLDLDVLSQVGSAIVAAPLTFPRAVERDPRAYDLEGYFQTTPRWVLRQRQLVAQVHTMLISTQLERHANMREYVRTSVYQVCTNETRAPYGAIQPGERASR